MRDVHDAEDCGNERGVHPVLGIRDRRYGRSRERT
jgi:hypothetical protein